MTKSKIKIPSFSIDGKSIAKSFTGIIDSIRYRKYAKEGYITVLHVNKQNNVIKILDGKITEANVLSVKGTERSFLLDKIYMLPTKKLVTKCCVVKEDCNSTLDIIHTDPSTLTPALLEKYTNIKIMEEFNSFNMGQVLLGAMVGIIVGAIGMVLLLMTYNAFTM